MLWNTLADVQQATKLEFVPELAKRHCFVRCLSGAWTRTLGAPDAKLVEHVRGRVYRVRPAA